MNAQNGHLDIGGVFDSTTEIYKNCFGTVWIVALVLLIPANIIVALLGNGILGIIGSLISLAASAWLMGSIIKIVQDVEADGRVDMSVGEILGAVWPRIIPIILLVRVVQQCDLLKVIRLPQLAFSHCRTSILPVKNHCLTQPRVA